MPDWINDEPLDLKPIKNSWTIDELVEEVEKLRILLAWSSGALHGHEAEAMLGVEKGELWGMRTAQLDMLERER